MTMKWVKRSILGLVFLILLALVILVGIINTRSGLHFALNTVVNWLPGLEIANIFGDLDDLSLQGVHYQRNGISIDISKLNLSFQINFWEQFQLYINNVLSEDVSVRVDTEVFLSRKNFSNNNKALTRVMKIYSIFLNQITLKNINIKINEVQIFFRELMTAANWELNTLTIKPTIVSNLVINLPKNRLQENNVIENTVIKIINGTIEKLSSERIREFFSVPLLSNLPKIILPIDINIHQIRGINWGVVGKINLLIDKLILVANLRSQKMIIEKLDVMTSNGDINLIGDVYLSQNWPINVSIRATSYFNHLKEEKVDLRIVGAVLQKLKLMLNLSGPIKAHLVAKVALAEVGFPIHLILKSQDFNWPLQQKTPEYHFDYLVLHLHGNAINYNLSLRSNIDRRGLSPVLLILDAIGNREKFKLTRLRLNMLPGILELTGMMDFGKVVIWNGSLILSDINTEKIWPQCPVKLQGKIITTASIYSDGWKLEFSEITLDGNVKDNVLQTRGKIIGNSRGKWSISNFHTSIGNNKLTINGDFSHKWKIDGVVDAPILNSVFPDVSGNIKAKLKLRGDLRAPQFIFDALAKKIKWRDYLFIDEVIIQSNVHSNKQGCNELGISIRRLKVSDLVVNNFNLNVRGNEKEHNIKVHINGKPVSGHLGLQGHFDQKKGVWKGVLNNVLLNTSIDIWKLSYPVEIKYINQKQEFHFSSHCWLSDKGSFCLSNRTKIGKSTYIDIFFRKFDLSFFNPLFSSETNFTGKFDGNIKIISYGDARVLQVELDLVGNRMKIKKFIEGSLLELEPQKLILSANINGDKAALQWFIKIGRHGRFLGKIHIDDLQKSRKLSGTMNIKNISLALVHPELTKVKKLYGDLSADLRVFGNMKEPLLNGNLIFFNIVAKRDFFPFDINQGFLKLNFMENHSELVGHVDTKKGYLKLTGEVDWHNIKVEKAKISIVGKNLDIILAPMVYIDLDPDIVFEATSNLLSIHGNIKIPWARIAPKELPKQSVIVSLDETMLDSNLQPINKKSTSIPILSNLEVKIGNDVRLDAFGLKARLAGILKVIQDGRRIGLNGEVSISDGRFHAYGQDLIVRKGQVLFSFPIDKPFLNLEAIRNPESTNDNVIAGIRITGLLDKLKATIFSEPVKSQQEALSYLVKGEGLSSSNIDSTHISTLLISMGVSKSGKLLGNIGEIFGLSEIVLDTQGVGEKYQVVVTGKITNDLQVKYSIGIFNSFATLTVRYRLMPKLYLEAVSGVDQTLDLLYQFEF